MSKCSKSYNPNANFERLKEIDILLNCVMGIANLEATHMNAPNSLGDVFQKAKSRLLYLIPGEGPTIKMQSKEKSDAPETLAVYSNKLLEQLACINDVTRSIEDSIKLIPPALWGTFKAGEITKRDINVAVVGDLLVLRVDSDILKESGYTTVSKKDPMMLNAAFRLIASLDAREAEAKKSKPKVKPGGTLKAKVKTVSSVETVKPKSKKKGKA